ncbi:DUF4238 domain-containing protein [Rugamonas apoptosis]|uniref:DUF4238 domain-containing protein n=1 Tax=Rugamonas apoptosis TaxID=2758570 RepID=A0A7W2IJU2_9BURK|nr:DUF4238 domain-containing protein [Rugamonas apoptosis]MBA5686702.1 DUF4238 domain-containing protein [Rugamonas apoptosis]
MLPHNGSTNHHYIPQFYLKGFCRSDGTFDVYDKSIGKFKKAPQTPAIVFFEPKRNTIKYRGQTTDIIEQQFSRMEASLAELFKLIRNGLPVKTLLSPDGVRLLKFHMALQFWRLPRLDKFSNEFLKSRTIEQVAHMCTITVPPLPASEVHKLLQSDEGYRKFARAFFLPLTTFDLNRPIPGHMEWKVLEATPESGWSNHLCTDAPFIFGQPNDLMTFSAPFIFPLTNTKLLVGGHRARDFSSLEPIISTKISMLSFLQANRYVVASNKDYLTKVIGLSENYDGFTGILLLQNEVLSVLTEGV